MYNGGIINDLLKERRITKKEFINSMGWSTFSQFRQFTTGNPTAKLLERAADFFQISVDDFFIRNRQEDHALPSMVETLEDKISTLETLIDEKDKRIMLLEKLVATLESGQNTDSAVTKK